MSIVVSSALVMLEQLKRGNLISTFRGHFFTNSCTHKKKLKKKSICCNLTVTTQKGEKLLGIQIP